MASIDTDLKRFEVHSGGYGGPSFSVEKDGEVLVYKIFKSGYSLKKTQKILPTPKEWKIFLDSCDRIRIWEWHPRYEEPGILDGSSWRVIIEKGDKQLVSLPGFEKNVLCRGRTSSPLSSSESRIL